MFEIRYVALLGGLLPSLFKPRSQGLKWPYARGSWVWSIELHRQYEKNLQFQNYLAQILENWYRELNNWALLSLLKWWPQVPESSAALGFGLELLNSGERFRAIMVLLFEIILTLTLLHSERPKLHLILAFLSAIGLKYQKIRHQNFKKIISCQLNHSETRKTKGQTV